MPLLPFVKRKFQELADSYIEGRRYVTPSLNRLRRCRIVAHRGDHGYNPTNENSLAAFDRAAKAGVWGIELDIRFTTDGEPMVFHDALLSRVYGSPEPFANLSCREIRHRFPGVPTLAEVVQRFGKKLHLMIEIKEQPWPHPSTQNGRFQEILSALEPAKDFHLLCLHPRALDPVKGFPPYAKVAVSEYWPDWRSQWTRRRPWGGLCGHYVLLRQGVIRTLQQKGQKVGTGYIRSRNGLFREINRGVDWIFSNDAVYLQQLVNSCMTTDPRST